jgi:hypothetical protein
MRVGAKYLTETAMSTATHAKTHTDPFEEVLLLGAHVARAQERLRGTQLAPVVRGRLEAEVRDGLTRLRASCDAYEERHGAEKARRLRADGPPRDLYWEHSPLGACYGYTGDPRLPASIQEYRALMEPIDPDIPEAPRTGRPKRFPDAFQPTTPRDATWARVLRDVLALARRRYAEGSPDWRAFIQGFRGRCEGRTAAPSGEAGQAGFRSAEQMYLHLRAPTGDWATQAQREALVRLAGEAGSRGVRCLRVVRDGGQVRLDEIEGGSNTARAVVLYEDGSARPVRAVGSDDASNVLEILELPPLAPSPSGMRTEQLVLALF